MKMSNRLAAVAVAATISIAPIAGTVSSASAAPVKSATAHTKVVKQTPAQKQAAAKAKAAAAKAKADAAKRAAAEKNYQKALAAHNKAQKTYFDYMSSKTHMLSQRDMDVYLQVIAPNGIERQRLLALKAAGKGNKQDPQCSRKGCTVNKHLSSYTSIYSQAMKYKKAINTTKVALDKAQATKIALVKTAGVAQPVR